jgi:L-ascorbate metabolism protein UlaG (beta-lactamase superfamily)
MKFMGLFYLMIFSALCMPAQATTPQIEMRWLGGPSLMITFNDLTLLTDPMLGEGEQAFIMADPNEMFDLTKGPNVKTHKRLARLPQLNLNEIDLVLLSHAHEDHLDQTAQQQLNKNTPVILPAQDHKKVQGYGFKHLLPLTPGDERVYQAGKGTITITAVPADHTENKKLIPLLGEGLGYFLKFKQGDWQQTVYWSGDSMPTKRVMSFVRKLGAIDVFIPNMGRVGTTGPLGQISLGAKEAVLMASALGAEKILPIHHSTYELYLEPISELVKETAQGKISLDLISEGSTLIYK